MKRVLALLGDYYHNHSMLYSVLKLACKKISDIVLIDSDANDFINYLNENPAMVVLGKEYRLNPNEKDIKTWMTPQIEQHLISYVENGGNLFVWHSGLASYPKDSKFVEMLRGYFEYHPEKNKLVRYFSNGNYLISKRDVDFEVTDEHYFVFCDTKNTNVFLYSKSEDGESIAGWTHNYGLGKILCLTPSHREEGLMSREMNNLLMDIVGYLLK